MMKRVLLLLLVGWSCGCPQSTTSSVSRPATTEPAKLPAPTPITGLPVTLTLKQRSTLTVPGSADELSLSIADITRGQVEVSIRSAGDAPLPAISMSKGDSQTFRYRERSYTLALQELSNALIGEDFASFRLAEAAVAAALTEQQKIDLLISRVESLPGATFVRNGADYSPSEAAKHLRDKLARAGERLKTADDFIEQIASRSSLSGDEYQIRMADGRTVSARDFLRAELKTLSVNSPPGPAAGSPSAP